MPSLSPLPLPSLPSSHPPLTYSHVILFPTRSLSLSLCSNTFNPLPLPCLSSTSSLQPISTFLYTFFPSSSTIIFFFVFFLPATYFLVPFFSFLPCASFYFFFPCSFNPFLYSVHLCQYTIYVFCFSFLSFILFLFFFFLFLSSRDRPLLSFHHLANIPFALPLFHTFPSHFFLSLFLSLLDIPRTSFHHLYNMSFNFSLCYTFPLDCLLFSD